jgi:hypothetical protein
MQIFIAKEQLGDYFNYNLDYNSILFLNGAFNLLNNDFQIKINDGSIFIKDLLLFTSFGVSNTITEEDGYFYLNKKWEIENKDISSGIISDTTKQGKDICLLKNTATSVIYTAIVNGTFIDIDTPIPDGNYDVYYQLVTEEKFQLTTYNTVSVLHKNDDNLIEINTINIYKEIANGFKVQYDLPISAEDTNYIVKINGKEITSGVTKNLTNVIFDVAPEAGKVISIEYNKQNTDKAIIVFSLYSPTGDEEEIEFFTNFSEQEINEERTLQYNSGLRDVKRLNSHYSLSLTADLFEDDIKGFVEKYRDKTFRIKVYHKEDGKYEVYSPCKIVGDINTDYYGNESDVVTIEALNKYYN